jgi:hypothetical protein
MNITLYQTLEDRDNPEEIERDGPYKCERSDAWLGHGYYFWEGHLELAHFWGATNFDSYVICKADATLDHTCWDLHNNAELRIEFYEVCKTMVRSGLANKEELLVSQVIEFYKSKGQFKSSSIRMLGMDSVKNKKENNAFIRRLGFKKNKFQYFDLLPPIQICLIKKNALSLQNFLIVYPTMYVDDIFA